MLVFTTVVGVAKTAPKIPDVTDEQLVQRYIKDLNNLSYEQRGLAFEIARLTFAFNLSYTAIAIAWQESNLDKYPVNLSDPSCGPFHKMVVPYLKGRDRRVNSFTKNQACAELMSDIELSTSVFLEDMEYWKLSLKRRGIKENTLTYMIRSYNAGYNVNSKAAKDYEKSVKARIKALQQDKEIVDYINSLEIK